MLVLASGRLNLRDLESETGRAIVEAYAVVQDDEGFVLVGSDSGLYRYDGYEYDIYRKGGTADSLPHNHILSFAKTSDGTIWVGTRAGLARFDPAAEEFRRYSISPQSRSGIDDHQIHALAIEGEQGLWVGSHRGLFYFDIETETFTSFYANIPFSVHCISRGEDGLIFGGGTPVGFLFDESSRWRVSVVSARKR